MAVICISLMTNEVENLFMYLLDIYILLFVLSIHLFCVFFFLFGCLFSYRFLGGFVYSRNNLLVRYTSLLSFDEQF